MANTRSAKKRMRQTSQRTARNRQQRSALRRALRKVREAPTQEAGRAALLHAEVLIDRAARKRLIHPNAAARRKSRLLRLVRSKA